MSTDIAHAEHNLSDANALLAKWQDDLTKSPNGNETTRMQVCVDRQAGVVAFWTEELERVRKVERA